MLRITVEHSSGSTTLKLEGRVRDAWSQELDRTWGGLNSSRKKESLVVDLRGVTSVDTHGENLLAKMYRAGAEFITTGPMTKYIVEKIKTQSQRS